MVLASLIRAKNFTIKEKDLMATVPVDVTILMSKIAVGARLVGGEFTFGLFEDNVELYTAQNSANGLITFPDVHFDAEGEYHYTAKETGAPDGWNVDTKEWPIHIAVTETSDEHLHAVVTFPDGVPVFVNKHPSPTCGSFIFPELFFTEEGEYEYTLKELTPSGGGWITDDRKIKVIVNVIDDGHGNLVATVYYPGGLFPSFTNRYHAGPARIIISGCKIAIGAPLPADRFVFGLYDEHNTLISTVSNDAADETLSTEA